MDEGCCVHARLVSKLIRTYLVVKSTLGVYHPCLQRNKKLVNNWVEDKRVCSFIGSYRSFQESFMCLFPLMQLLWLTDDGSNKPWKLQGEKSQRRMLQLCFFVRKELIQGAFRIRMQPRLSPMCPREKYKQEPEGKKRHCPLKSSLNRCLLYVLLVLPCWFSLKALRKWLQCHFINHATTKTFGAACSFLKAALLWGHCSLDTVNQSTI